jgi:hypothetical protein
MGRRLQAETDVDVLKAQQGKESLLVKDSAKDDQSTPIVAHATIISVNVVSLFGGGGVLTFASAQCCR